MIQETKITKYKKPIFLARGLTKDQEKYLGKIIKNSDEKDPARKQAIGELIYHNQNLMYSATNYYMPKLSTWGLDRDDFLSEANFAILRSAEKFDYTRARFSTLVYKAVYNSFTQLINKQKKDSPDIIIVEPELSIGILQIENMQKRLSLKPFSAPYKIAIINDADKMTVHAQNRLLKTLEEPKGQTIIILISSKPETLLETIISRVQPLKFYALSKREMRNFLKEKVSISELEKLIFISEGKPGKAISLLKDSEK